MRSALYIYQVSGLSVAADIPLPGLIPCIPSFDYPTDVTISAQRVPTELELASSTGITWQISDDEFLLEVPGIVRMLMRKGRQIDYMAEPGVSDSEIAIFLISSGFGILLHQRDRIVLHASAVRVDGRAILFCGPSGAGKSTLAAALVDRGYDLVTDDFCSVEIANSTSPIVHSDGRQLKLWKDAVDELSLSSRRRAAVRPNIEKYFVEPQAAVATPLPLAAIYVLRVAGPLTPAGILEGNAIDRAILVKQNSYRPSLIRLMDKTNLYFSASTAIARSSGVFILSRELDYATLPKGLSELERHFEHTLKRSAAD